eukprot:gene15702-17945_t
MKRQLEDIDRSLPRFVLESDGLQDSIQRINAVVANVDSLLLKKQRIDLALNAEPPVKQKVLRVYVRHEFYAATESEKSFFLVNIEGMLLDEKASDFNLMSFFERISIQTQTEKKNNQGALVYDWSEADFPLGGNAHSVQAKVYADKSTLCRVSLHRSTAVQTRYNISDQLRAFVPYLRFDPTEEEVLLAVWQYIELNGLIGSEKDKRYFKLTEGLKELLLGDRENPLAVMLVSALRTKLSPHMVPARPVLVDHFLNIASTPEAFALSLKSNYSLRGGGRWPTAIAYSRVGGRVFELEVDVRDQACLSVLAALNKCTAQQYETDDRVRLHAEKLAYLARRLHVLNQERTALTTALDLLISPGSEASNTIKDEKMDVDTKPASSATEEEKKNDGESRIDQQKLQDELLLACLCPLYQRIRQRPATERVSAPAHTPLASVLRATAQLELSQHKTHSSGEETVAVSAASSSPRAASSVTAPAVAVSTAASAHYSSLHTLSGYLDVGNNELFQQADTAWLKAASEQLVNEKSKPP